jgi:hypothetical protein
MGEFLARIDLTGDPGNNLSFVQARIDGVPGIFWTPDEGVLVVEPASIEHIALAVHGVWCRRVPK